MKYAVWMQQVLGYGAQDALRVIEQYGSAKQFYEAAVREEKLPSWLSTAKRTRLKKATLSDAEQIADLCRREGIRILPIESPDYPARLKNIFNPPAVLYIKGELPPVDERCLLTVVGPRHASDYGEKAAFSLARRLASAGCIVVSGGAVGIDGMAHKGALSVGKPTVAVLGGGFHIDYPKGNHALREEIVKNGCLVSEYPPDFTPTKSTFPQRNRIMSALSLGTVVIEAGEKSGALSTAAHAATQGKDLFVVPGNPSLPQYAGSNQLLKDGAKPVLNAADILEEYYAVYRTTLNLDEAAKASCTVADFNKAKGEPTRLPKPTAPSVTLKAGAKDLSRLSEAAAALYEADLPSPFTAEDAAGFTADVLDALMELQLEGLVEQLPGGRYKRY